MPIRLIPFDSDPESDLETQLAVMAALVTANLMSVVVLQGRQELRRHPEKQQAMAYGLDVLPKLSVGLYLASSIYFLTLSRRDAVQSPQATQLQAVFWANVLTTSAVLLKTRVVFQARPESTASIGAVEP